MSELHLEISENFEKEKGREPTPRDINKIWEILKDSYTGPNGERRWKTSDNCLPSEVFEEAGMQAPASQKEQRDLEAKKFADAYRAHREKNGYSEEELAGMKAAFGNEEVVDVITGKTVLKGDE